MKTMLVSDLLVARQMLLQLMAICIAIGVVICYAMETTVGGVAAIAAMAPFMYLFTLAAYDEQNGWERFRLTLPLSRRQVVLGRYASVLLVSLCVAFTAFLLGLVVGLVASVLSSGFPDTRFSSLTFEFNPPAAILASVSLSLCFILLACAITLPLIARYGMTKATRFVPLVAVILLATAVGFLGDDIPALEIFTTLESWMNANNWAALTGAFVVIVLIVLAIYCVSAFIATKLYEKRNL